MPKPSPEPQLPVPKNWTRSVQSALLHVIALAKYTLVYKYIPDDGGMTWATKSVDEGPIKSIEGEYVLEELDEDETEVTYRMTLDLKTKLPGILMKRGEKMIIRNALDGLKKRVEQG